jgi:hypothetical protein
MKQIIILSLLFLLGYSHLFAQRGEPKKVPDSPNYKISVTTEKKEYSLGEPIVVTVQYYNGSDLVWSLYRPDSSCYCAMIYRNKLWDQQEFWNCYAFNESKFINTDPQCTECGFSTPIVGDKIQLNPKEKEGYSFSTDIMKLHELYKVLPGSYEINFLDAFEAIYSDTIKICLKFTPASVDYVLERLINEKKNSSNIRWAKSILSDIYPDIKKYQFKTIDGYSVYYTKELKKLNKKFVKDFLVYWKQNKNTEEVKQAIKRINTDFRKYDFMCNREKKSNKENCAEN